MRPYKSSATMAVRIPCTTDWSATSATDALNRLVERQAFFQQVWKQQAGHAEADCHDIP
jgi:hypothetical protein